MCFLLDDDYERFIYSSVFQMANSDQLIWKIASWQTEDFDEDVVVLPVKGVRTFRYSDFGLVSCQPWIQDRFRAFIRYQGLMGKYGVVHLRAGSKRWAGGSEEGNETLKATIRSKFPNIDSYLEAVHRDLQTKIVASDASSSGRTKTNDSKVSDLVLLSDSPSMIEEWLERYQIERRIERVNIGTFESSSGLHKVVLERLEQCGTDKAALTAELLLDFHLMLNASYVARDGVSLFSQMADMIRTTPGAHHQF